MSVNWCNQCAYQSKISSERLKRELSHDPGTLLLVKHTEISISYYGDTASAMFSLSHSVHNSEEWSQPRCPSADECTTKRRHIHNRILYESFRKIEGYGNALLYEVTQPQKNKCHMFSLVCGSLLWFFRFTCLSWIVCKDHGIRRARKALRMKVGESNTGRFKWGQEHGNRAEESRWGGVTDTKDAWINHWKTYYSISSF